MPTETGRTPRRVSHGVSVFPCAKPQAAVGRGLASVFTFLPALITRLFSPNLIFSGVVDTPDDLERR